MYWDLGFRVDELGTSRNSSTIRIEKLGGLQPWQRHHALIIIRESTAVSYI